MSRLPDSPGALVTCTTGSLDLQACTRLLTGLHQGEGSMLVLLLVPLALVSGRLVVREEGELVVGGTVDVWRIVREAELLNSTMVPSDECPG